MHSDLCNKFTLVSMVLTSLPWLVYIAPVQSAINEKYILSVGANFTRFNTNLKVNSKDNSVDSGIDLEDDAGFDSTVNSLWISGSMRISEKHRFKLIYIPIRRTASKVSLKDIEIQGTTIKAGAAMDWESDMDIFDFSYIYSVYKKPELEVGLSIGVYWLSSRHKLHASGNIADADGSISFNNNIESKLKFDAPLPLLGVSAVYELSESWRFQGALRYLELTINNIEGRIASAEIGSEYYFNQNWGMGASLAYFSLDVDQTGIIFNNSIKWSTNAIFVYGVFKY